MQIKDAKKENGTAKRDFGAGVECNKYTMGLINFHVLFPEHVSDGQIDQLRTSLMRSAFIHTWVAVGQLNGQPCQAMGLEINIEGPFESNKPSWDLRGPKSKQTTLEGLGPDYNIVELFQLLACIKTHIPHPAGIDIDFLSAFRHIEPKVFNIIGEFFMEQLSILAS